jgi:hypothetical protein
MNHLSYCVPRVPTRSLRLSYREFSAAAGLSCIQFPQLEDAGSNGGSGGGAGLCFFTVQLLYRPGHYDILYSS